MVPGAFGFDPVANSMRLLKPSRSGSAVRDAAPELAMEPKLVFRQVSSGLSTVRVKVVVPKAAPSPALKVTVVVPKKPGVWMRVRVRDAPVPEKTMLAGSINAAFPAEPLSSRASGAVSGSDRVIEIGPEVAP